MNPIDRMRAKGTKMPINANDVELLRMADEFEELQEGLIDLIWHYGEGILTDSEIEADINALL